MKYVSQEVYASPVESPEGTYLVQLDQNVQELNQRLEAVETWIDQQKYSKPGSKNASRAALHAHMDAVLDANEGGLNIYRATTNSFEWLSGSTPNTILHAFFRELLK